MSAGYFPFHPNPSKTKYKPPAGAVDAHCHVFGPEAKFPYAPERKYTPCDAPKERLFALRDFLGFDKNVIVQASCHSKDNRAMVDALETSDNRAKGVAFVGAEVTDAELKAMDRAGPPYDDVVPFGRTLVEHFPDRVIWGTDWPHPNQKKEAPDDGVLVDYIPKIAPTAAQQRSLLVDNPMRLYWSA